MSTRSFRFSSMSLHIQKGRFASTDRDALAFLEAAQIYQTNQQRAIVDLVRSLKRVGLWSKMKAIYPFIGGTATTHKWNLKDPRDLDAAFRLTFSGGWTHSSTGAKPNGTSAYADTFLTPSTALNSNSVHLTFYSGSNVAETNADPVHVGSYHSGTEALLVLWNDTYDVINGRATGSNVQLATNTPNGLNTVTMQSATVTKVAKNTTLSAASNSGGTLPRWKIFIGNTTLGANTPYASGYVFNDFRFVTIGDGLTDTDVTNFYNIVDLYQKRLGRAV